MKKIQLKEIANSFRGFHFTAKEKSEDNLKNDDIRTTAILNYEDILSYERSPLLENTIDANYYDKAKKVYVNLNKKYKNTLLQNGDIVYPVKQKLHIPRYINLSDRNIIMNCIYPNETLIVRALNGRINTKFLFFLLNTKYIRDLLDEQAINFKPNRITCEMVDNLEFNLPEIQEQERIVQELELVNMKRIKLEEEFLKLVDLSK